MTLVGRLHPLLIHFPIALVIVGLLFGIIAGVSYVMFRETSAVRRAAGGT